MVIQSQVVNEQAEKIAVKAMKIAQASDPAASEDFLINVREQVYLAARDALDLTYEIAFDAGEEFGS